MPSSKLTWIFPRKNFLFLRIEVVFVIIIAVIITLLTKSYFQAPLPGVVAAVIFIAVYAVVSQSLNAWRRVEEKYHLTPTHFEVVRKTRRRIKTEKVPWKHVHHHALDKRFLGGYLLSRQGKHLLFFNTRNELEKFEKFLGTHWKKKQ